MTRIGILIWIIVLAGCGKPTNPTEREKPPKQTLQPGLPWEKVAAEVVFSRNFMSPLFPEKEGLHLLPDHYRLGSKAFAKSPPAWWLSLAKQQNLKEKWNCTDFPLAYAGQVETENGPALLVVQVTHSFTGDGFFSPGPVLSLVAFLFAKEPSGARLVATETTTLGSGGSFQFSRLHAGKPDGRFILFRTESGSSFDSREITGTSELKLRVEPKGKLHWERE
ncbi:MAG: hypothetical protein ACKO2G_01485 [Verrucomicrobiales bacterium]